MFEQWHFIRPYWLLALPISFCLLWFFYHYQNQKNAWQKWINPELLKTLTVGKNTQQKIGFISLLLWLVIASIALAGPSFKEQVQPVSKNQDALVIVLDLSLSMLAQDEKPSRLIKAKRKITDVLNARKDGQTALVVYSGDAHAVTPLSDDNQTLKHLLKAVKPQIMPSFGSNAREAFTLSQQLIFNSGQTEGKILWLGDEVNTEAMKFIGNNVKPGVQLQFIAFGTEQGAPIILPNGFLKDANNQTVIAKTPISQWQNDANRYGFNVYKNQLNNQDFAGFITQKISKTHSQSQQKTKVAIDAGPWLVLLSLPWFLLLFRKNAVFLSLFLLIGMQADNSQGDVLPEFLKNDNQKAYSAYQEKDYTKAQELFSNPKWRAASLYQQEKFAEAAEIYQQFDDADSQYNLGNAYAKMGEVDKAIEQYNKVLQQQPGHKDAKANKALVEKLKKQQEQQQQEQQQNQDGKPDNKQKDKPSDNDQKGDSQKQNGQQQSGDNAPDKQKGKNSQSQNNDSKPNDKNSDKHKDSKDGGDKKEQDNKGEKSQGKPSAKDGQSTQQGQPQAGPPLSPLEKEQQQALEQWLKKIPDDPSGYLQNKFNYQYQKNRRQQKQQSGEKIW